MSDHISAAQARRIFLDAQGLARRRPGAAATGRRVGPGHFREYLQRQGVVQLDSVNVLARAHYLPVYSRYGPYDQAAFDAYLWSSGETFEHWGHEASVMPIELLPHLRFRMNDKHWLNTNVGSYLEKKSPGLVEKVEEAVRLHGPLTAADIAHLDNDSKRGSGGWWNNSDVKWALDMLFYVGRVAINGRPGFQRLYDSPERTWGEHASQPALSKEEARQRLFDIALAATGIGTPGDIGDHFRIKKTPSKELAESAVARGLGTWVEVEGWKEKAVLAAGATDPGRATGAALLSPFDPVCWYRDRLERMFACEYRIEIYTPAPKRKYGYYCLMFLQGDQITARVDLKADRKANKGAGVLVVKAAWREERVAPGARRRSADEVATALAEELATMARWLGLAEVRVEPKGDLAAALSAATRA